MSIEFEVDVYLVATSGASLLGCSAPTPTMNTPPMTAMYETSRRDLLSELQFH